MTIPASDSDVWRIENSCAELHAALLAAQLDLAKPMQGLGQLSWDESSLEGSVLGVATGDYPLGAGPSDAFARGDDLVASYTETDARPFSLQVYWRAVERDDVVFLDAILSLQTPLLESFPGVSTQTRLNCDELWIVPSGKGEPQELNESAIDCQHDNADCILVRADDAEWSYAEMTHPDDRGQWQIKIPATGQCTVQRELGGAFLEKGVIRRLRVRGAFLPRNKDFELARECMTELAASAPPLTT